MNKPDKSYSLEAHLKKVAPEGESLPDYIVFNARAIFQACEKLTSKLTDNRNKNFVGEEEVRLKDKNGHLETYSLALTVQRELDPVTDSAERVLCFLKIILPNVQTLAWRGWAVSKDTLTFLGAPTHLVTSDITSHVEGFGLGIGLVASSELVAPALVASQSDLFSAPTVTFQITDQAYSKDKDRFGWSSAQAKAMGYTRFSDGETLNPQFYKQYRVHRKDK